MNLFWDTSAVLSLVVEEPTSDSAREAWERSDLDFAWRWLVVEASAGLARRRASPGQWKLLDDILADIRYVDMPSGDVKALCRANREWALRAADAGHLYVFKKALLIMPDIELICFDRELCAIAKKQRLPLWREMGEGTAGLLRERRASYGSGKRSRSA